jgi:MFS superfamily sulfate permease-like transporter
MTRQSTTFRSILTRDLPASFIVFLVALPLCMGIAIASGVPPALGLVAGIVGGLVIGPLAGSPLQVSGPAAGLAVIVAELVAEHGIAALGPVVLVAGLVQVGAGVLRFGQIFRAISPAVIYGMLSGIGVLILASQFHVMFDARARAHGVENLLAVPGTVADALMGGPGLTAGLVGGLTIATLLLWERFKPGRLKLLPGALVAVVLATAIAQGLQLPIAYVQVPGNLTEALRLPDSGFVAKLADPVLILEGLVVAFIASTESLLSAAAVDRLHQGPRTDYDRELAAQGVGNVVCGLLGALPMTGVIVRSSVNVHAGAQTRTSAIFHGVWLLALVALAPGLLSLVPTAALAGILVFIGFRLIEFDHVRKLARYGTFPPVLYFVTLATILATDLLIGVLVGLGLATVRLLTHVAYLEVEVRPVDNNRIDLHLAGAATFLRLPQLAVTLEALPPGTEVTLHLQRLAYIDHTCLDLLSSWCAQHQCSGGKLIVEWNSLHERMQKPIFAPLTIGKRPLSGINP